MNAQLTNRGSLETESEMLPQEPPPWIIRFSSRLLLAMFFVALVVAIFVHLPETVHCPFVLVPNEGAGSDSITSHGDRGSGCRNGGPNGQSRCFAVCFALGRDSRFRHGVAVPLTQDLHTHEESLTKATRLTFRSWK